jgi:nucleoside-diphosphate-sugar epimerase
MKKIVIAGASGFIGYKLIDALLAETDYNIVALSRSNKDSDNPRLEWKKCDLFSVLQLEEALSGCDYSYYLVHSMQPSARLDQANFLDYDLILADNFGRAAKKLSVTKVVYLSGIIPNIEKLSDHLLSRLEVEEVLRQYFTDFVILRAGLVLGKEGSSFNILMNLVKRLPILVCPSWTKSITSPVHISTVISSLVLSLKDESMNQRIYDLSSSDSVSYQNLLKITARKLGLKRIFVGFPLNVIFISRLWVSLFSGASRRLVYPLLESLSHSMVPRADHKIKLDILKDVESSIGDVVEDIKDYQYKFSTRVIQRSTVRSVQRFSLPPDMNARQVAIEYMYWLPRFLFPFIIVDVREGEWVYFSLLNRNIKLLVLKWSPERSSDDRQLFYIKGGLLSAKHDKGRLEFREVLNKRYTLAAIHNFSPSLPWYIYRYTQAVVHFIVMTFFGRHLYKISKGKRKWLQKP